MLEELRSPDAPLSMTQLVERTGLHENTLRGHLAALVRDERVTRIALRRSCRGRPAWGYLARGVEYADLALALAEGLDQGSPADRPQDLATRGGRAWGRRLCEQLAGLPTSPRDRLVLALAHTGFAPTDEGDVIRLTRCPLVEAARAHPAVVCSAHLGLIQEVLGEPGAGLEPFVEPDVCLVRMP